MATDLEAATATGVGATEMCERGSGQQVRVSSIECACGHSRSSHRSYYGWTGSTACTKGVACCCDAFRLA